MEVGVPASRLIRWLRREAPPPEPAAAPAPPSAKPEYREHWNSFARQDAFTAILSARDGSATDTETFDHKGQEEAELFARFVTPDSIALDIGCGVGRIERHLAPRCKRLYAVDVSDEMLARAREWCAGRENLRFVVASAAEVDCFLPGTFDFIFSYLVLQHLEYEDAFLALCSIARMLKPGARAFVQFPLLASSFYTECFVRQAVNHDRQEYRVRAYTLELAEFMCRQAGLEIERMAVGLDGLVSEHEIGIVARRPAAG
jgi:ubiquinone/menaquinone biosynthesis C-methylase UbiE